MLDNNLPDDRQAEENTQTDPSHAAPDPSAVPPQPSLTDDIVALVEDGKTYFDAELHYQKSRLGFAADRGKSVAAFGLMALGFVHLALIALVVGLVIALTPLITAWGATALVTILLLLGAYVFVRKAAANARQIGEAFDDGNGTETDR